MLNARVVARRRTALISVGDGGDKVLIKCIWVQANYAEYAPLRLVLLLLTELGGAPLWAVHVLGVMLVGGRICHAIGIGMTPKIVILRIVGMVLTFTMLGLSALVCLGLALV